MAKTNESFQYFTLKECEDAIKYNHLTGAFFEASIITGDKLVFDPHGHDEYVISANITGNEDLVLDGIPFHAPEGTITLYNPAQIQAGVGTSKLISLYLSPSFFSEMFELSYDPDFIKPIVHDPHLFRLLSTLHDLILHKEKLINPNEWVIHISNYLLTSYSNVDQPKHSERCLARTSKLQEYLMDDLSSKADLQEMAKAFDISVPTLIAHFTNETGYTPIRWQRIQRLKKARILLKQGTSPLDVANHLGFADQSHLTRLFHGCFAVTPSEYARAFR